MGAIKGDGAHVVLYGERGRGKTSLVNLVAAAARSAGYMVGRHACSFDSDFESIIRGLVRDLPASLLAVPAVDDPDLEGCEAALPRGRPQPRDIAALPGRLAGRHLTLIADEFDRVEDAATRTWFADTIKQVSDRGSSLSFIIVGVSDSLEELLGRHPSIQRNVLGLALPLLSDQEIVEILVQGGQDARMTFLPEVCTAIAGVARGVPYMAQLLGLHSGTEALSRAASTVELYDLRAALHRAVEEADPRVAALYEKLTTGERDIAARDALRLIVSGEQDRFARFAVAEMGSHVYVAQRAIDAVVWRQLREAGAVRNCQSAGPDVFTFADPMLPHYILLREAIEADAPEALVAQAR
jgi:hypothetical protein